MCKLLLQTRVASSTRKPNYRKIVGEVVKRTPTFRSGRFRTSLGDAREPESYMASLAGELLIEGVAQGPVCCDSRLKLCQGGWVKNDALFGATAELDKRRHIESTACVASFVPFAI